MYLNWLCLLSDSSQLWKLDGGELKNKADKPILDKKWNITTKKTDISIVNILDRNLVIGISNNGTVIEEDFVDGKPGQVWKRGKPDAEGYFSLKDSKSSKILTATSSSNLEVIGNHT